MHLHDIMKYYLAREMFHFFFLIGGQGIVNIVVIGSGGGMIVAMATIRCATSQKRIKKFLCAQHERSFPSQQHISNIYKAMLLSISHFKRCMNN